MENIEKFEKYLLNKKEFIEQMLIIIKDEYSKECYQIELELLEDIIHHFNVIVKGEISTVIKVEQ